MTYQEYIEKYNYCFGHESYDDGERMPEKLEDLLENLKDKGYECPDTVEGGVPVKIYIDVDSEIEGIQDTFYDHDFAGEDYEISKEGEEFLKKCFEEYNEKYANHGNYCDTVDVIVPEEMKYELSDDEIEAE